MRLERPAPRRPQPASRGGLVAGRRRGLVQTL